jgi:hypothetical protein
MSMPVATGVDIEAPGPTPTVRVKSTVALRILTAMTPIAAYYVMVATDHEREMRQERVETIVARPSLASRVVTALETLVRLGRPATTQPV